MRNHLQYNRLNQSLLQAIRNLSIIDVNRLLLSGADVNYASSNDRNTAMHLACEIGNSEIVSALLIHFPNLNLKRNIDGFAPLHCAVKNNHNDVVLNLLMHQANPDSRDDQGFTPLNYAVENANNEIVMNLLLHQANPNSRDNLGLTPLHHAVKKGNIEMVRHLFLSPNNPDSRDFEGLTPLHYAVIYNNREIMNLLLLNNANPNICDFSGCTPFHLAVINGDLLTVSQLFSWSILPNNFNINLNLRTNSGHTAIHFAGKQNNLNLVNFLLKFNADPNKAVLSNGFTALHYASAHGNKDMVQMLLDRNAKIDGVFLAGENGYCATPLHLASINKKLEIAEILLQNGANINYLSLINKKPIDYAIANNDKALLNYFLIYYSNHPNVAFPLSLEEVVFVKKVDNGKSQAITLREHLQTDSGYDNLNRSFNALLQRLKSPDSSVARPNAYARAIGRS